MLPRGAITIVKYGWGPVYLCDQWGLTGAVRIKFGGFQLLVVVVDVSVTVVVSLVVVGGYHPFSFFPPSARPGCLTLALIVHPIHRAHVNGFMQRGGGDHFGALQKVMKSVDVVSLSSAFYGLGHIIPVPFSEFQSRGSTR
ncbi:hypothetical protein Tco_0080574 [Tanacetum coccineum]